MKVLSFTQQGQRPYQEDASYRNDELGLFIVCDGVGGAVRGDIASQLVIETIVGLVEKQSILPVDAEALQLLVDASVQALHQKVQEHPDMEGMGTTLTLLYLHSEGATLAHVGDSRIYFIRSKENKYWRTKDHSLVQELFDSGVLPNEEAMETHPMRNRITRALQGKENAKPVKADVQQLTELQKGDLFFLCTDGVLEPYTIDSFIANLFKKEEELTTKLEAIKMDCAEQSKDNNTCILIELGKEQATENEQQNLEWKMLPIVDAVEQEENIKNVEEKNTTETPFFIFPKWMKIFKR